MTQRLQKLFDSYRRLINKRLYASRTAQDRYGITGEGVIKRKGTLNGSLLQGRRTKFAILKFYEQNGRWPKRVGPSKRERLLGARFENMVSKEAAAYDRNMRRIVLATGRKPNFKRKHDVEENKKLILDFITIHGRTPQGYKHGGGTIEEHRLNAKLHYYTVRANDMVFLQAVYALDPCYKTNIAKKYRPMINRSVQLEKPLVHHTLKELEVIGE